MNFFALLFLKNLLITAALNRTEIVYRFKYEHYCASLSDHNVGIREYT